MRYLTVIALLMLAGCGTSPNPQAETFAAERVNRRSAVARVQALKMECGVFEHQQGRLPTSLQELAEYRPITPCMLTDPWGKPYEYQVKIGDVDAELVACIYTTTPDGYVIGSK